MPKTFIKFQISKPNEERFQNDSIYKILYIMCNSLVYVNYLNLLQNFCSDFFACELIWWKIKLRVFISFWKILREIFYIILFLWKYWRNHIKLLTYLLEMFVLSKGHLQLYTEYEAAAEHLPLHRNSGHYQPWPEAVLLPN